MPQLRNRLSGLLLALLLLVSYSAPVLASGAPETARIQQFSAMDATGNTVELKKTPTRIIIAGKAAIMPADALFLFPEAREMEVLLAVTNQGLGDFFNLLDPTFVSQRRIGQQVSAEEILALKPDLVLTKLSNYESLAKKLRQFGVPTFVMDLESSEAWKTEILELGKLLGNTKVAQEVVETFNNREQNIARALESLPGSEKPTVLVMQVASADGVTAFSVAPSGWIQTMLVQQAGGKPVWLDADLSVNAWKKVSFEQIAAWNPDYIYLISYRANADAFLKTIRSSEQWGQLKAVRNNAVKSFPADVMNYAQSDSRWILALEWLASDLHPDRFSNFDMEERIQSFYKALYRIS
ncbi:MAG: ABC transporter substrate-binding protein, partial [Spirochaetae bacterium HGW-Spirochaetae-8]